jgi:hypothetical protein
MWKSGNVALSAIYRSLLADTEQSARSYLLLGSSAIVAFMKGTKSSYELEQWPRSPGSRSALALSSINSRLDVELSGTVAHRSRIGLRVLDL